MVASTLNRLFLLVIIGTLVITVSHGFSCWDYANGCNMPDFMPYKALFTPACVTHDVCYRCGARNGIGRRRCDDVFRSDMAGLCVGQSDSRDCNSKAYTYYRAVRALGGRNYFYTSPSDCSRDYRIRSVCLSNF